MKILVAEDNPINQKLIRTTLEKFGIDVTLASNGQEAFDLRKQNDYDLIFMDIQMPVMNGLEATNEILHYEEVNHLKHIPIIALTANALTGDREKYMEAGMDNYISKPINIPELKNLISSYNKSKHKSETKKSVSDNIETEVVSTVQNSDTGNTVKEESSIKTEHKKEQSVEKVKDDKQVTTDENESEETVSSDSSKIEVILFNKAKILSKNFVKALSRLGINTKVVNSEDELIEAIDEGDIDYVLVDYGLLGDEECMVMESIDEMGIKPYLLVRKDIKDENLCAGVINITKFVSEVKNKLLT